MWCPLRSAAAELVKQGHDVFLYDFVHPPAVSVNWPLGTKNLGAFHGAEVPFVFGDTFELVGGEVDLSVRNTHINFCAVLNAKNDDFDQDRLGTNIGKTQKEMLISQESMSTFWTNMASSGKKMAPFR
eukprot:COSAG06_NODE_556_length_14336_cov_8.683290_13_plen_128_part_00